MTTLQHDQQLARIDRHLKVLVIGVIPGNLGVELERHPRVDYGTAEDYERKTVMLPEAVGRVFLTRYCSHKITDRIRPLAAKQGVHVVFHHEGGMGALRKAVWESLGESPSGRSEPGSPVTAVGQALREMKIIAPAPPPVVMADEYQYRNLADFLDARWDWHSTLKVSEQAAALKHLAERLLTKQWSDATFKNTCHKWYADRLERRTRPATVSEVVTTVFKDPGVDVRNGETFVPSQLEHDINSVPVSITPTRKLAARAVTTVRKMEATITLAQLREAFGIPENASVTVRVPGGADWSNTDLDLEDHPIEIAWEERS